MEKSEHDPTDVGGTLRAAREQQGLSGQDVARQLNWHWRQLEAIEGNDFDALGSRVFVRGYVNAYAKLLGLPQEELLAQLDMPDAPRSDELLVPPHIEREPAPAWQRPWVNVVAGILAVLLLMVGMLFFSGNGDAPDVPLPPSPAADEGAGGAAALLGVEGADGAGSFGDAAVGDTLARVDAAIGEAAGEATVQGGPPGAASTLRFAFSGECWVEVYDATGGLIHSDLHQADGELTLQGRAPFDVLLGDARRVTLYHQGRPVPITARDSDATARLTVGGSVGISPGVGEGARVEESVGAGIGAEEGAETGPGVGEGAGSGVAQ